MHLMKSTHPFAGMLLLGIIPFGFVACSPGDQTAGKTLTLLVGAYTEAGPAHGLPGEGIYLYTFDTTNGKLSPVSSRNGIRNPSYLAVHPNRSWVYAVSETNDDAKIYAFRLDATGKNLDLINAVPAEGKGPCHISLDRTGRFLFVANWGSGSVAMLPIDRTGALKNATAVDQHSGPETNGKRPTPHAHMVLPSADNNFLYCPDMGMDQTYIYQIDPKLGTLVDTQLTLPANPGAGPRHLAFHPDRPWVYVLNELNGSLDVFSVHPESDQVAHLQTLFTFATGNSKDAGSADIHISKDGKYLYTSNRGKMNTITQFSLDQETGKLQRRGVVPSGGKSPRSFTLDPSGKFLLVANQDSGTVVVFRLDPATGALIEPGTVTPVPAPACLKFLP